MTTATRTKMTDSEAKTFSRYSAANATHLRSALSCGCEPYKDIFTFGRWIAQGFSVKKGEKCIKIPVVRTEDREDGTTSKIFHNSPVFCRHQVQPLGTPKPKAEKPKSYSYRAICEDTPKTEDEGIPNITPKPRNEAGRVYLQKLRDAKLQKEVAETKAPVTPTVKATSITRQLDNSRTTVSYKVIAKTAYKLCDEHTDRDFTPAMRKIDITVHDDYILTMITTCEVCLGLSTTAYWAWFDKQAKMKIRMPQTANYQKAYCRGIPEANGFHSSIATHDGNCCAEAAWTHYHILLGLEEPELLTWDSPAVIEMVAFNREQTGV